MPNSCETSAVTFVRWAKAYFGKQYLVEHVVFEIQGIVANVVLGLPRMHYVLNKE
jgi:hypothetical protein